MGRISALTELSSLANDDYLLVLDTSANIAKKISVANAFGIPDYGWTATGETWTYSSWTSGTRTGTITVPSDATTKYQAGMRIKISQSTGGTKYGIITKVASTTLTVFFPSGTTLNNETISTPYYSSLYAPYGFDTDPTLWSLEVTDTTNRTQSSPTYTNYYNLGSISLTVPIGVWDIRAKGQFGSQRNNSFDNAAYVALSKSSSTETETDCGYYAYNGSGNSTTTASSLDAPFYIGRRFNNSSSQTFYVIHRADQSNLNYVRALNSKGGTTIKATIAYV